MMKRISALLLVLCMMLSVVPAMAETIALLRKKAPEVCVMVGGAVLNEEYAKSIGADGYAPDAMGAVRFASAYFEGKK